MQATRPGLSLLVTSVVLAGALGLPVVAATPTAKPEEVGLSTERLRRITELVERHIAAGSFSGAVTLVARHNRIAHFEAQGLMDIDSKTPMRKDAIFRIMSMTKPVVGVSIMMLVEQGKVRLQDPVSRFIPELKDLKVAVPQSDGPGAGGRAGGPPSAPRFFYTIPAEREITVRDLLTHTSGLVSGPISNAEARKVAAGPKETVGQYVARLGQVPLEFQPGTRWAYSAAAGFDVLVRVVEVASGMPYDRFAKQHIFDPLGMNDTTFTPPAGNPRLTTRYERTPEGLRKGTDPGFMNGIYFSGGGGLYSTPEDYLQFALMLLNDGQWNGRRLLSPRSVELMRSVFVPDTLPGRPRGEPFGLSMRVVTDPAARNSFLTAGSFGWSGAFGTHFWVDPKEKLVAIAMAQTSNNEFLRDFETLVMQAVIGSGAVVPTGTN